MRSRDYGKCISRDAPVFIATVMEYLCTELLALSGDVCLRAGKKIIKARHMEIAVRKDAEFERLFLNKTFEGAGKISYDELFYLKIYKDD